MKKYQSLTLFAAALLLWLPESDARLTLDPGSKAVIKLGVCPSPSYQRGCPRKQDECVDDLDCPHEALCCTNGCLRSCTIPEVENVVGYLIMGTQLSVSGASEATTTSATPAYQQDSFVTQSSLSVSHKSWNTLLNYLCAVADQLDHSDDGLHQCKLPCTQDSDCPQVGRTSSDRRGGIKCCNNCCLDPSQYIVQPRTNYPNNKTQNYNQNQNQNQNQYGGQYDRHQYPTTLRESRYLHTTISPVNQMPPATSGSVHKPGMCPPVLVQSRGNQAAGPCDRRCHADGDCYGPEKCCSNGCGYACQRPISLSLGYGAETLSSSVSNGGGSNNAPKHYYANSRRGTFDSKPTTRRPIQYNSPLPIYMQHEVTSTQLSPITVLLGAQRRSTTETPLNTQKCKLPPTSYTECIGVSPWRTRYYYHKGLNQCLPIYRCIRTGNNFYDLASCEVTCVAKDDYFL